MHERSKDIDEMDRNRELAEDDVVLLKAENAELRRLVREGNGRQRSNSRVSWADSRRNGVRLERSHVLGGKADQRGYGRVSWADSRRNRTRFECSGAGYDEFKGFGKATEERNLPHDPRLHSSRPPEHVYGTQEGVRLEN